MCLDNGEGDGEGRRKRKREEKMRACSFKTLGETTSDERENNKLIFVLPGRALLRDGKTFGSTNEQNHY